MAPFSILFVMIVCIFRSTFSSRDSAFNFQRFVDGFWYHFWCLLTCFPFAHTTCLNGFTIQIGMIFDDCHDLFRYQFWHWILMSCSIDSGSILAPLWHQIQCFWVIVFSMSFGIGLFADSNKNGLQKQATVPPSFCSLFRPCSAGCIFEGSLAHFGSLLDPFCFHVGSFGYSFWSILILLYIKIFTLVVRICKALAKRSHTPVERIPPYNSTLQGPRVKHCPSLLASLCDHFWTQSPAM